MMQKLVVLLFMGWLTQFLRATETPALPPIGKQTGGQTSVHRTIKEQPFDRPAKNILRVPRDGETISHDLLFNSGNGDFRDKWIQAGASVHTRDGLGPYFNARSCEECHQRDGRGTAAQPGIYREKGLLLRIAKEMKNGTSSLVPVPIYGSQLQDLNLEGYPSEGKIKTSFVYQTHTYPDGDKVVLKRPQFDIVDSKKGKMGKIHISPRIAQQLVGLGLLENLPIDTLHQFIAESPPGVSGRISMIASTLPDNQIGRFGWKAEVPTVFMQNANAFAGDIGITSSLNPQENCPGCGKVHSGGNPEVTDKQLTNINLYVKLLGVPERADIENPDVIAGEKLFFQTGCAGCHRTHMRTGVDKDFPELTEQFIHPFTDLLLHDMGEDLSDQHVAPHAAPTEWRTAPLWGIGLVKSTNPDAGFLHDGRAESLEEAILWHNGEGLTAQQEFSKLDRAKRQQLLRFLESL